MARNVVLIGMMGSGKTTVGRILARKLNRAFLDTDREIERSMGMTVSEIFAEQGEAAFRQMETDLLVELQQRTRSMVVACGGGIVVRPENQALLKKVGTVVWLAMSADQLVERLRYSRRQGRPLLQTENWPEVVRQLLAARFDSYRGAADLTVNTDNLSPGQVVSEILRNLRTREGTRSS